jgi:hypothetical protein
MVEIGWLLRPKSVICAEEGWERGVSRLLNSRLPENRVVRSEAKKRFNAGPPEILPGKLKKTNVRRLYH